MSFTAPAPRTIHVLPSTLANQIAAGEVIERPASVVRELVENSLDAGATSIRISVVDAGLTRIEVLDNGSGIPAQQLQLALQRHATSKLMTTNDLFNISTFGFRGEALPSIGSVARVTLTSRPHNAPEAWQLTPDNQLKPAALPPGTRVVVEDLFYATPARRKFLKSVRTERAALEDTLLRHALAHPHVSFTLIEDGKESWHIPAAQADLLQHFLQATAPRLATLLGPDFEQNAIPVQAQRQEDADRSAKLIEGFISGPTLHTSSNRQQYLFVNGRPVKDKSLQASIRQAYTDLLPNGRYPMAVLFLTLPASEVDVNVHPAKSEVRFRESGNLFGFFYAAIRQALAQAGHSAASSAAFSASSVNLSAPSVTLSSPAQVPLGTTFATQNNPILTTLASLQAQAPLLSTPPMQLRKGDLPTPQNPQNLGLSEPILPQNIPPLDDVSDHPLGAAIGQVDSTYILAESSNGTLVIVDQHAAHERIVYEQLKRQFVAGNIPSQALLLPATVSLPLADMHTILHHQSRLAQFGLEVEQFSPTAVAVTAVPQILIDANPSKMLADIVNDLRDLEDAADDAAHSRTTLTFKLERVLATLACHHSIRAHRRLSLAEMNSLLRQMEATPDTQTCNHGRPTVVRIPRSQLEKLFERS